MINNKNAFLKILYINKKRVIDINFNYLYVFYCYEKKKNELRDKLYIIRK